MRKKLIFFTAKELSNVGGGERVLSVLATGLCQRYDIEVITPYVSKTYYQFGKGISIVSLGIHKKSGLAGKLQLLHIAWKLRNILHTRKYDYFIASTSMAIILTSLASWGKNDRLVAWIHTSFYQKEPYLLKYFFLHTLNKFIVIPTNTMDVDEYKKYANRVNLMYNPLSFHIDKKSNTDTKRIISVGRLSKAKGFDHLIKICSSVFRRKSDWSLDIYGQDDGEKKNLLQLIEKEGMQGRIRILDPVKNIHEEMVNSSIFCFCSLIECFGLVLLEACECGLPCIAFNSPSGIRDIVKDGYNGYLVDMYDNDTYGDRLLALLDNKELRSKMGANASLFASEFSDDKILKQWYELIG